VFWPGEGGVALGFKVFQKSAYVTKKSVKMSAYVTGEHLEGLLSCQCCHFCEILVHIVYKKQKQIKLKIGKAGIFSETNAYFGSNIYFSGRPTVISISNPR